MADYGDSIGMSKFSKAIAALSDAIAALSGRRQREPLTRNV